MRTIHLDGTENTLFGGTVCVAGRHTVHVLGH
jgi:hypothetical protein